MKINKLNYEVYAIDFMEGTLPDSMVAEMEQFLLLHPEVAKDIAVFDDMTLEPDLSVKYLAKDELKRPIQFAILSYMNWIIPIGISIIFMVAYPQLRTLWTSEKPQKVQPQTEAVLQNQATTNNVKKSINTSVIEEAKKNTNKSNNINQSSSSVIANQSLTLNKQNRNRISIASKSNQQRSNQDENSNAGSLQPVTTPKNSNSKNLIKDEYGTVISSEANSASQKQAILTGKEKSISDFKNRNNLFNAEELAKIKLLENQFDQISLISVSQQKEEWDLKDISKEVPAFKAYMTFSLPYSIGYDMAKTTNITSDNQLIRSLPLAGDSEVNIGRPTKFGLEADVHISEFLKLGTGFNVINRQLSYTSASTDVSLDINYRVYELPFTASLRLPIKGNQHHAINVKGGISLNLTGDSNYESYQDVGIDVEKAGTASLLSTTDFEDKMLTTNGPFKAITAMKFGLEYEKTLPKGALIFGLEYNRQMGNIGTMTVWDYVSSANRRLNPTEYNLRFETVMLSVKYVLPYKLQF